MPRPNSFSIVSGKKVKELGEDNTLLFAIEGGANNVAASSLILLNRKKSEHNIKGGIYIKYVLTQLSFGVFKYLGCVL